MPQRSVVPLIFVLVSVVFLFCLSAQCAQSSITINQLNPETGSAARQPQGGLALSLTGQRSRRLTALGGKKVPLTGNLTFWGEYFAYVGLGTPPQYVNLQVDTGTHFFLNFQNVCAIIYF